VVSSQKQSARKVLIQVSIAASPTWKGKPLKYRAVNATTAVCSGWARTLPACNGLSRALSVTYPPVPSAQSDVDSQTRFLLPKHQH